MTHPHPSSPALSLRADRALVRAGARSTRYVLASFDAPAAPPRADRAPIHVALVLDRSGSMEGARKFALAREAVEQALRLLRAEDRFALVVYDHQVEVLAPSSFATPEAKRRALDALRAVEPRGSTDLCAGWLTGCAQIAETLGDGVGVGVAPGVARALLLTDGLANHGTTDPEALATHAAELRRRGIATSTFGVGEDFDERLLRDVAHEGGGTFYFIESPRQIPDLLTSELGEALEVVIPRAALHVQLPAGATAEPLNRFRSTFAAGDRELRVELGDLVSGQEVRVVLAVRFPRGEPGETVGVRVVLASDASTAAIAEGTLAWTYASHAANDEQRRDVAVDREVAALYAARARAEATEANREGDFAAAERVLGRTAARIQEYAGRDEALNAIAMALRAETPDFVRGAMSPMARKHVTFAAESAMKMRGSDGRARRRAE